MLPISLIGKACGVSSAIALLFSFPSAQSFETQKQKLAPRSISTVPQHCGIAFNPAAPGSDNVYCTNYGKVSYKCLVHNCYVFVNQGKAIIPYTQFKFENCRELDPAGLFIGGPVSVHADQYIAYNKDAKIFLQVFPKAKGQKQKSYVCSWNNPKDINNSRAWCAECSLPGGK
ncbi:hypothetical protein Pst134EA_022732 [Puccinia striiformis f. sp. tritici]|uniref:hypothetical protein n=1 Tax=Puccinia striiformis f. sp. tritici TaxID=168172 RepID=UPI002007EE2D|nr:hypothetical protein Pst134EA_022732 [Puccinia striiformis f. sp. tritici]KAH9455258.1 hypothetical protein Pst134EA_022732 [Puccinia striiformis f. sp. tritici]